MSNTVKFKHRSLSKIAFEIFQTWKNVSPYARPYLDAMSDLDQVEDCYLLDSAESTVLRFLANAQSFRGEGARRIKKELKFILSNIDHEKAAKTQAEAYK